MSSLWTPDGEHPVDEGPQGEAPDEPEDADLAALRAQLAETPAAVVVANHCLGLWELAALHLSLQPPQLEEAAIAIDALGAVVERMEGRLGEDEPTLRDALAQARLAFVQIKGATESGSSRITLYGRMPVLEALLDERAVIEKVILARGARGDAVDRILEAAGRRGVRVERADAQRVTRVSRNGRHDQGVVIDIEAPGLAELDVWLAARPGPLAVLVLDGLTNPANVGMVIRTAAGAGLDGVVLPRAGCPDVGPLVVKASAGVALFASVLRAATGAAAVRALATAGVTIVGLAASDGPPLWDVDVPARVAFVLGNETAGVSPAVGELVQRWTSIPLVAGVDSLNVATAAGVVAFEVVRRRARPSPR